MFNTDIFWHGFASELGKVAGLPSYLRGKSSGAFAPGSYAAKRIKAKQLGSYAAGNIRSSNPVKRQKAMQAAEAGEQIKPRLPKPLPGAQPKITNQYVQPKTPEPSTPASVGATKNTAVPPAPAEPPAPKTKGASPIKRTLRGDIKGVGGAAMSAVQNMAPWMIMDKMQGGAAAKPKSSNIYT